MGTEKMKNRRGVCRGLRLTLQGVDMREDFLPLELGSTDLILGMKLL